MTAVAASMPTAGADDGLLYEQVAARVGRLIAEGAFGPGERVPSVRRLSREMRVSVSTVVEAYRRLENQGRIEARPQSGYYVRKLSPSAARRPASGDGALTPDWPLSAPLPPAALGSPEMALRLMRDSSDPRLLQLGAAIPNPELLPLERLHRTLARVIRESPTESAAYDIPPGYAPLRAQIAKRLVSSGVTLGPDEIVTTCGAHEAIYLCLRAVCRPGDLVAVESPFFYGILHMIEGLGLRTVEIPAHPRDGISLEALTLALERHPGEIKACLVISNYNNPLGSRVPEDRKKALVDMLEAANVPLIEDDLYGDLTHEEERPVVAKKFDRTGNVLLCSSFSKCLAPGYRVGWVAPGRWRAQVERLKMTTNVGTPTPNQWAVAEYLADGGYDRHLRRIRREYARRTRAMGRAVRALFPAGTRVSDPLGGYVLWVQMPESVDALALYEQALKIGVTIAPGPLFSAHPAKLSHCARLNAAFWSPRAEEALEGLGRLCERPISRGGAARPD